MTRSDATTDEFQRAAGHLDRVDQALQSVLVGQRPVVEDLLIALAAGGHVLLEGLPGLGKTHLVKGIAAALGLQFGRVQCTPDLMPADLTGSDILTSGQNGEQNFLFRPGPIFCQAVLVDEINRTTPRTQAALLEAMQEAQVSYGGRQHRLPDPFFVIATQNPIELEGTYPLPEAQLDRFMFKILVPYPDAAALRAMLDVSLDQEPASTLQSVLGAGEFSQVMAVAREVMISEPCKQAAISLVLATQPHGAGASPVARRYLRYGASPRALQSLLRAARVRALRAGRVHVDIADFTAVARPVLRHRVLLTVEAEIEGVTTDQVINELLEAWARTLS
jgi:MoxR-like ATPase